VTSPGRDGLTNGQLTSPLRKHPAAPLCNRDVCRPCLIYIKPTQTTAIQNEQNKKADPIRSAFGNILFLWLHRYSTSHSFIRLSFYSLSTRLSGRPLQEIVPALLPAHQPARRRDTRAL